MEGPEVAIAATEPISKRRPNWRAQDDWFVGAESAFAQVPYEPERI